MHIPEWMSFICFQGGDYINEAEVDIMYNGGSIPEDQSEASVLEHVPNRLGYAYVLVDPAYNKFVHPNVKHKVGHIQVRSFISCCNKITDKISTLTLTKILKKYPMHITVE